MNRIQKAIIAGLIVFVGVVVWAILSIPAPPTQEEAKETLAKTKIMVYQNNTVREEKDGQTLWELNAKVTRLNTATNDADCDGIRGKFFAKNGLVIEAESDKGRYSGNTKDVVLIGNAVMTTSDGKKLTADEITWYAATQLAVASGNVHVYGVINGRN